jgi:hypothetical protein
MLGMENLNLFNMDLIFHLNSMPRVCGSFETMDLVAHVMSRLEYAKFQTLYKGRFFRVCEKLF